MIWKLWAYRLAASTIKGVASAVLSYFGVAGLNAAGVSVTNLDLPQLGVLAAAGAIVGFFTYLKTEPLP